MSKAFDVLLVCFVALVLFLALIVDHLLVRGLAGLVVFPVVIADVARRFWPWAKRHPIGIYFLAWFLAFLAAFLAVLAIAIVAPQLLDEIIQAELNRQAAL